MKLYPVICSSVFLAVLLMLLTGCSVGRSDNTGSAAPRSAAAGSSVPSSAASSEPRLLRSGKSRATVEADRKADKIINEKDPDAFYPIRQGIVKAFYDKIQISDMKPMTVSGGCDLNGDGKEDTFKLSFQDEESSGKKSELQINGKAVKLDLNRLEGVYAVDLDKSDSLKELAVVDYGMDVEITTYFYRWNGSEIVPLGSAEGGFSADPQIPGYHVASYNNDLKINGKGEIIPQFGVMEFISPQIVISKYAVEGNQLKTVPVDLSASKDKTYTVTGAFRPFFEAVDPVPPEYTPEFDDKNFIRLKAGQKLKIHDVKPSMAQGLYSAVTLPDGRKGVLYFFLQP